MKLDVAPCNCGRTLHACKCPWRAHLFQPLHAEVGWLYDDGETTEDATLSGLVYPDHDVDDMKITIDRTGEEHDVSRADRRAAEGNLREAAHELWWRETA